jgi:isocitrate dehydrogenase
MFTAEDFMSSPAITTHAEVSLTEAVGRMRQHGISSLLVAPLEANGLYGIVTKRDVISKVVAQGNDPNTVSVGDVMSAPVVSVPPAYSLQECSLLMAGGGFRRLPVFVAGEPVGILSDTDIFAAVEEAGWGPQMETDHQGRDVTRSRLAAKLSGTVPYPEALAESILAEIEQE